MARTRRRQLDDATFDAFAGSAPAPPDEPPRPRTRRGGPRAPLPLLPLIGLCAGVGVAYVAQTAHVTQASYQESRLAAEQRDLRSEDVRLGDDLARLRSPVRITAAAERLGMKPPARWAYVAAVPAPVAAPAARSGSAPETPQVDPAMQVLEAMLGSFLHPDRTSP